MKSFFASGGQVPMPEFKHIGRIHSLGGAEAEITVIKQCGDNDYIVNYNGVRYHAIFNFFVNRYYVDDIYGICPTPVISELQNFVKDNPNSGGFEIQKDSKEEVKSWLHKNGYVCEPSANGNKIHIEYWRN